MDLRLKALSEDDFEKVIDLGERIHGKNYLTPETMEEIYHKSFSPDGNCCSYVLYDGPRDGKTGKMVGFRLTYAPGAWEPDKWCSVDAWGVPPEKVCYFKSNTIDSAYRGQGLGPYLLDVSMQTVKQQGAVAGVTHIWMSSSGYSPLLFYCLH
jgi:ribosomal protein S18 acetylase RimI-like enzyme